MSGKISFGNGDLHGEYVPSDSEDEYTEREKSLLAKARNKNHRSLEPEEEVYGFSESDSDSAPFNSKKNADSDIEDADDDIPDARAWGRKKSTFYSTNYIDEDYGGFTGREEEIAEAEENEARILQEKLAKQLEEADFTLDVFVTKQKSDSEDDKEETVVKSDLSGMSKRQKLQMFYKESPEFQELVNDCKEKLNHCMEKLQPLIQLHKEGKIPNCTAMEFINTQYHLILNYCTNISFYLLLKSRCISVSNHPIVKRLFQYRQLLAQLQPTYDEMIEPQIKQILELVSVDKPLVSNMVELPECKVKTKKLKLISSMATSDKASSELLYNSEEEEENEEPEHKKLKIVDSDSEEDQNEAEANAEMTKEAIEVDGGDGKRKITYEMAKNKGLTPYRKKELRNPRVKHRNKFRKAIIRRKGAIREVRTELTRYSGEMSGIKSSVKKSTKIK